MSRSNPNDNGTPNPATRWFEWNGEKGVVRYYDKDAKQQVEVGSDFTFLLLDQLGSVRGWDNESDSGIYSNEVKDTRQEVLVVKSFKGGTLAEGIYKDIKDRVNASGGKFVTNCYIAFKNGGCELSIGSLRFKGAALRAWMEFTKEHRSDLYKKAVRIHGSESGKKGRIVFHVPVLELADVSDETNRAAVALDAELQAFFKSYFARTRKDQADHHGEEVDDYSDEDDSQALPGPAFEEPVAPLTDDDIPF